MSEPTLDPPATSGDAPLSDRLDAWKDIASYLKRDISTVQRWERREGMPVHRHLHDQRGSVYASRSELDHWIASRGPALESSGGTAAGAEPEPAQLSSHPRFRRRWVLATACVVLALSSVADHIFSHVVHTAPPAIRSLAVLPLQNLSGDASQEYFADGMTEAVIGDLSVIPGLRVVSRTSAMQFKGTHESAPEIARRLSVDALVEGAVSRAENRVRIDVQLIRGPTDDHVWSASYERELRDVLALESEIAHAVARQVEITVADDRLRGIRSVAPDVYDNYLKGRFALNRNTKPDAKESIAYFEAAIAADPSFALAYSGMATAYTDLGRVLFGASPHEARPKVFAAARKALSLDPNLIEAHVQLGDALQKDWQWKEADAEFRRAVELAPNSAAANTMLGRYLICLGRFDEAIAAAERGKTLDPLALRGEHLGWILFMSRRYKEAIRAIEGVLAIRPDDANALWELGFARLFDRQPSKAVDALERSAEVTERSPAVLGVLVHAYAAAGRVIDAQRILDEMIDRQRREYVPSAAFVNAYLGLGDREHTFLWLERGFDERSNILQYLKVHPVFDDIRSDRRFSNLVRRVGLPE
jgi:TolB-like protein/Flp pilus assembly protein TadD